MANTPAIPGVSLAALDAIEDGHTREVLRALVDGWQVRNGSAGNGNAAFVTREELGLVGSGRGGVGLGGLGTNAGSTSRTLSDRLTSADLLTLQRQVLESKLFKQLGQRIQLVDDATYDNGNKLTQEITDRTNDDNALVQAVNTMWSKIGDSTALIQRGEKTLANNAAAVAEAWNQVQATIKDPATGEYISSAAVRTTATTAVNKAGDLEAQYTVKVDVNGYVAGYGLASTATNSTPFSEFIVRADRFAIGSPDGTKEAIPFIVTTTTQNGQPPGVYMDWAFIANASISEAQIADAAITSAKIKDGEVDTLKIKGNAVTVPSVYLGATAVHDFEGYGGIIIFSCSLYGGQDPGGYLIMSIDGAEVHRQYVRSRSNNGDVQFGGACDLIHTLSGANNVKTITVVWQTAQNPMTISNEKFVILGAKR